MTLSPAIRHTLDRALLILTAMAVLALLAISLDRAGIRDDRWIFRIGCLVFIGLRLMPWLKGRYAAWQARPVSADAPERIRRVDLYIALAVFVIAAGLFAQSRRYTVTHYVLGNGVIYQRTDTWSGRAELWTISGGPTQQPAPSWVRLSTNDRR